MLHKLRSSPRKPKPFTVAAGVTCQIQAAAGEGDGKLATFTGVAYTGAPMTPDGWGLPIILDLAGVKAKVKQPALRQHDHEQVVGHTESVDVDDKGINVSGVFSGEKQHTDKVIVPAKNGFPWQMSVGANPLRLEYLESGEETEVNGRVVRGPIDIARETEVFEVSFVPLGADDHTSATVSASKGSKRVMFKAMLKAAKANGNLAAAKYSDEEIDKMSENDAKAALRKCMADDAPPKEDEEDDEEDDTEAEDDEDMDAEDEEEDKPKSSKSRRGNTRVKASKAQPAGKKFRSKSSQGNPKSLAKQFREHVAAEERSMVTIKGLEKKYGRATLTINGKEEPILAYALENDWSAEKVELELLRASRASADAGRGPLVYSTSSPEVSDAVLEAAVLDAARHQFKLDDDDFYVEDAPDHKTKIRRIPHHLQRQTQDELKARYSDQVRQAAHTIFKGQIAPKQIIAAAFRQWGHSKQLDLSGEFGVRDMLKAWDYYENPAIRAEGSSNLSISNILSNVQNKFALQGYLFTEQAWREFCAIRPVKDFKPTKTLNLLGDVMYKQLGPSGELEHASIGDQAFANQANPFGRILTIPWTHIVNDDLGMLTGAPLKIGQGAGLALLDQIFTLWKNMAAGTVSGDDGNAFWRTTSLMTAAAKKAGTAYMPNKTSGAGSALSATSLQTVKALFDNQVDPNGNPLGFDGMTPIILHGPTNWQPVTALLQAVAIVYGGATAALQPNANVWQGQLKPVMSRYIENANYVNSTTAFWVLFNPVALAVIEVCFLNGVDTPAVLQAGPDYQFDKLGISIRGTMPFGANQQNFRGGVYSVGA